MQISAISTPNFSGRRDNVDALIGLDDNSIRQIAFAETSAKFDRKNQIELRTLCSTQLLLQQV